MPRTFELAHRVRTPSVEFDRGTCQPESRLAAEAFGNRANSAPSRREEETHMFQFNKAVSILATFTIVATGVLYAPQAADAQVITKLEQKCASKLGKSAAKLTKTIGKEIGKCRLADLKGPASVCPSTTEKIDKIASKLAKAADKSCGSVCSISNGIRCISDASCPPLPTAAEKCSAGAAAQPFHMESLGFPGAFCESVVGGPLVEAADIATCVDDLTRDASASMIDAIFGSLENADNVSDSAQKCLKGINKGTQKLVDTIYKSIVKCRDSINKGKTVGNPATCTTDDLKAAAKIAKIEAKLDKFLDKCSDDDILELDLCDNGPGGTPDVTAAKACLKAAAHEITDTTEIPALRTYSAVSLVEAAYPPVPVCGDNVVNQTPNPFLLLGEECDGTDDSACPGQCLPPGDVFECTCGNVPRIRYFADGLTADLDSGWSGSSHNQGVADGAGFVTEVSNCDCDAFDGATCVGSTSDSICDRVGPQLPTCSWDAGSSTRCDAHGNGNTKDEDLDCRICDQFNVNAGAWCVNESNCQAQCYPDAGGGPTGLCTQQTDCAAGETCRGQCDLSPTCFIVPNGAPLPISSGGTAVCVETVFRQDVTGTTNIVTGEHALNLRQFSIVNTAVSNSVPCPVCGGFCDGGPFSGEVCAGTCSSSGDSCRFDTDCPVDETCTTASVDCPGSFCNLSLVCGGGDPGAVGPAEGQPCRVEAATTQFGTVSNDCPANPNNDISSGGLQINFLPQTSEAVGIPPGNACSAPGYELFDCPCPDGGGAKTKPNLCTTVCDNGAEEGTPCADFGGSGSGQFTTCSGGLNAGASCDEDSDCDMVCSIITTGIAHKPCTTNADCTGGMGVCQAQAALCNVNPKHCLGDPAFNRVPCTTNGDCGIGTCEDACPSGRCRQLCAPTLADPQEGKCVAGSYYHCSGSQDSFRVSCSKSDIDGGCSATCSISGNPCVPDINPCGPGEGECQGDCPIAHYCEAGNDTKLGDVPGNTAADIVGAGICIAETRNCFLQPVFAEGGDTLNGQGDPTNVRTVAAYCVPATTNSAINSVAGLGGPGRLREDGVNVPNFDSLP
jgi:hypothetical protein